MKTLRRPARFGLLSLLLSALLSACSLAPVYHVPEVALDKDAWQSKFWKPVSPDDQLPQGDWWLLFQEPELNRLEQQIEQNNPSLAAALARYDAATAYTRQLQASQGLNVDSGVALTNNRQSDHRPLRGSNQPNVYDANTVGLSASYPLDIWGQIRNAVAAGSANAQASAADLRTVRLALQTRLADTYMNLRGVDGQISLLEETVTAYTRALQLTQDRHAGGIASGIDVSRAQTQLRSVMSEESDLKAQRAIYEHAIASLLGRAPVDFHIDRTTGQLNVPQVPVGLPSELLLRRPDIAAAERRVAAANANIGVARAAYYPSLALGAAYGVQNTGAAGLFSAPNTYWSIGPLGLLNLFDAGRHDAQLDQARAQFNAASADYRSTVLSAIQQVEDNLARLEYSQQSAADQDQAVRAAQTTLTLAMNRYREGAVNYLEVVTSQEAALNARSRLLDIHTLRLRSTVDLIGALGGSWSVEQLQSMQ